jgi:hypothetical protein
MTATDHVIGNNIIVKIQNAKYKKVTQLTYKYIHLFS